MEGEKAAEPVGAVVSSSAHERVSYDDRRRPPDTLDRMTRFIKDVGFPVAVATALICYLWFVGSKTNEHLAKGSAIMERAVDVIERLERKLP